MLPSGGLGWWEEVKEERARLGLLVTGSVPSGGFYPVMKGSIPSGEGLYIFHFSPQQTMECILQDKLNFSFEPL